MSLDARYDENYRDEKTNAQLPDFHVRGWPRHRIEAVIAEGVRGKVVLDIGCGDGTLLYQLRDHFEQLWGLEYSPVRLKTASTNLDRFAFRPICGNAEDMVDITDQSVDCIVTADVIEHIPDVYAASAEMFRVLRPGGTLIINTPNIAFLMKRLRLLRGRFPSTSQPNEGHGIEVLFDGGHLHYFTYRSLRILLERSGFQMVKKVGYGPLGQIHNLRPELMSVGVQWIAQRPS